MKRVIVGTILLLALTAMSFGDAQFRLTASGAADFAKRPTLSEVTGRLDEQNDIFWGPQWEMIFDRVSMGMHTLVKFDQLETGVESTPYDWSLDWLGDLYLGYHIFGGGAFIDPFIEFGFGNVGRVDLNNDQGQWELVDGEWEYSIDDWDPTEDDVQNLALYPYIGGGIALDFDGFVIGARMSYRPTVIPIPVTQFEVYPLRQFQVALFAGVGFGGH